MARARVSDPSAWRNFPKPRPLRPGDRIQGPLSFYGVPARLIADFGRVSLKHAELIKAGKRAPSPQLVALVCLYRDERVLVGPFARFRVRGRRLITPEGLEFTESELRGIQLLLGWARSVAAECGRSEEFERRLEACREDAG